MNFTVGPLIFLPWDQLSTFSCLQITTQISLVGQILLLLFFILRLGGGFFERDEASDLKHSRQLQGL